MAVGHPSAYATAGAKQLQKSWYVLMFQEREKAERMYTAGGWAMFKEFVDNHSDIDEIMAS